MTTETKNTQVVIIGAGISGLATAFWLKQKGIDVIVLEKNDKVGGAMQTEYLDGYIAEHGPNTIHETSPLINELIEGIGIKDEQCYATAVAKNRYVLKNGTLHAMPLGPIPFLKTNLFSARAKLRLAAEPFIGKPSNNKEESVAEFITRRLGKEFLDYAINPFIAGMFAGDPKRLSVQRALPKSYALEKNYGSLLRGIIRSAIARKKRGDVPKQRAKSFSFKKGLYRLPEAIANGLGNQLLTKCDIQSINPFNIDSDSISISIVQDNNQINIKTNAAIFATPSFRTANLVKNISPGTCEKIKDIEYAPIAIVFMGFKQASISRSLDGFGFLVPEVEKRKILGSLWNSTIFPDRSPEGYAAFTTFVGGTRQPELVSLDDKDLVRTVYEELKSIIGISDEPALIWTKRWNKAIPQYNLGYSKFQEAISKFEQDHPGFFITGNYRSGISVGDCIVQANNCAEEVAKYVKEFQPVTA